MRILVVGAWQWKWYQEAFSDAFKQLGHEVAGYEWAGLFRKHLGTPNPIYRSLYHHIEDRLLWGPVLFHLNRRLLDQVDSFKPDAVFAYNGTHVLPGTLKAIKQARPSTLLIHYSNDNPFSSSADPLLWRHVKTAVPLYDLHFVYRHQNVDQVRVAGGRHVHLLRSYFIPETDFRQEPDESNANLWSDVVFAGHYEPDARFAALEQVARMPVKMNLFGGGWRAAEGRLVPNSALARFFPVNPVIGARYRMALSGAKIALCFLSKLNGDSYTRRNFEIPATRTFMLSEYSPDLASLYEEGKEAEFFRSPDELVEKIRFYLEHDAEREAIARAGQARLLADGHDILSRAKQFMSVAQGLARG
jgi:spore maturation protein CgeB